MNAPPARSGEVIVPKFGFETVRGCDRHKSRSFKINSNLPFDDDIIDCERDARLEISLIRSTVWRPGGNDDKTGHDLAVGWWCRRCKHFPACRLVVRRRLSAKDDVGVLG